ncbi:putative 21.2 kDa [Mycena venus]|uniref:Putative 21.2 kDa n=1 Tax=Mycena venus TaxID=2733690 RepID=A0A8H6YEJ1_9AGAR|nr:putative 21.2 kDa [Mycena venus]
MPSTAYDVFLPPIDPARNGFDFHVYYNPQDESHARDLHTRISHEFPELRMYKFWDRPVGPHPIPMFEVNTFTPHQTGALFSWLVVNRGPCPVLIHPNTDDELADHTTLATWMGTPLSLKTDILEHRPRAATSTTAPPPLNAPTS